VELVRVCDERKSSQGVENECKETLNNARRADADQPVQS
jgi:hypothetical protein